MDIWGVVPILPHSVYSGALVPSVTQTRGFLNRPTPFWLDQQSSAQATVSHMTPPLTHSVQLLATPLTST